MDSPGRLETIRSSPTIILDGAHNAAGAKALASALSEDFAFDRLVGVIAILSDKDVGAILSALDAGAELDRRDAEQLAASDDIDELANEAVEIFGGDRVDVERALTTHSMPLCAWAEEDTPLGGRVASS